MISSRSPASSATKGPVYTLGASDNAPEDFLQLLKEFGVEAVVDVRRFPASRFPHFDGKALEDLLRHSHLTYVNLGEELGSYRPGGYESHMLTVEFKRGMEQLERIASEKPTAIMCAERLPWKCHRRFIAFELMERGWRVVHIIDDKRPWRFRGAARV